MIDLSNNAPTQYIRVGLVTYAYRRFGKQGAVPIIGLQHFTGTLDSWDPLILNELAAEREVIIFDNTGVGNSGGETPDNVAGMTADAAGFIHALGLTQVDLLGFSLGGFIAQSLAHDYPSLVRKLILVGTAPQGVKVLEGFNQLVGNAMQMSPAERFLYIFFTSTQESRKKGVATLERLSARSLDVDRPADEKSVNAQMKAITRWGSDPITIKLAQITQPALVVQGSDDVMMDSDNSYKMFQELPNAVLTLYPDSAHGSFFQFPEMFAAQVNHFLNQY